ncbi:phosphohistidine phosphatase SixA [Pseudomonas sp. PLB05]|jgi:phosphohistidine phosphatase|uniref:phosphohistidine phosphatase SixA n=1 Tax=Pseudomonas sp. PLB05 TaxID=2899078 RepID=UPI001E657EBC|nr:phosphohistidine phosphatase SixA [Pseudomonas sp. PLB05]MCD4862987.1 phosphohistidine phosphatase SixA [Pseudomonas sp. PLB05]
MKLWLLRHGEAEARASSDELRELTMAGRAEVLRSALQLQGAQLQLVLASPYVRAQQTAALVQQQLGWPGEVRSASWATPDGEPERALDELERLGVEELLLVTHNPFVAELAGWLLHGHWQAPVAMGTASLLCLEAPLSLAGGFELVSHFHG